MVKKKTKKKVLQLCHCTFKSSALPEAVIDRDQFCVRMKNGKYVFFSAVLGYTTICDSIGFDEQGVHYED